MPEYRVTEHHREKYTVRIHKPILTEEELKAREDDVKKALIKYGKEKFKNTKEESKYDEQKNYKDNC